MKHSLPSLKTDEKEQRSFFDYRSNNYLRVVQSKNNTVVYIGSTFNNIEPAKLVERYISATRKGSAVFKRSAFTNTIKA